MMLGEFAVTFPCIRAVGEARHQAFLPGATGVVAIMFIVANITAKEHLLSLPGQVRQDEVHLG